MTFENPLTCIPGTRNAYRQMDIQLLPLQRKDITPQRGKNNKKCISRIKKRQVNIDGAHEKNIFELLIKGHKAMSAYQLIDNYSQHYGQVLKPMQVYRVLKKLITKKKKYFLIW